MEIIEADQHDLEPPYVYMTVNPKEYFASAEEHHDTLMVHSLFVLMEPIKPEEWKELVAKANEDPSLDYEVTIMPATAQVIMTFAEPISQLYRNLIN